MIAEWGSEALLSFRERADGVETFLKSWKRNACGLVSATSDSSVWRRRRRRRQNAPRQLLLLPWHQSTFLNRILVLDHQCNTATSESWGPWGHLRAAGCPLSDGKKVAGLLLMMEVKPIN
jgi:hypothetical protein